MVREEVTWDTESKRDTVRNCTAHNEITSLEEAVLESHVNITPN